jgi:hypothetical protein
MAIRQRTRSLVGYGIDNALQSLAPQPIIANRAPTTSDTAPLGALWVWPAQDEAWILVSNANATATWNLIESSGGAGVFSSLLVNPGPVTTQGTGAVNISADAVATTINVGTGAAVKTLTLGSQTGASVTTIYGGSTGGMLIETGSGGDIVIDSGTGEIDISTDAAANTVKIATGAAAKALTLGSLNTTSATTINAGSGSLTLAAGVNTINIANDATTSTVNVGTGAGAKTLNLGSVNTTATTAIKSGTGGISLASGSTTPGSVTITPITGTVAEGGTDTVTANSRVIYATYTGYTTANSGGTQVFKVASSLITTTSAVHVTVTNLNTSGNGAFLTVTGIIQGSGLLTINTANNGAGALGAGDTVIISVWVIN